MGGKDEDLRGIEIDKEFMKISKAGAPGIETAYLTSYSFSEEFGKTIQGDVSLLSVGYLLIILYCMANLGRFGALRYPNTRKFSPKFKCLPLESRILLSLSGILSVGLAIAGSMGVCSMMGFFYGPVHSVLPFLLLGIGVDDMFIIANGYAVTSFRPDSFFKDLSPNARVRYRIADALRHAGASITITSVTDFLAFAIGSSTILPALSSFCVYAAVGIMFDYWLQVTFFAAFLTLDSRRQSAVLLEGCINGCCARRRCAAMCCNKFIDESCQGASVGDKTSDTTLDGKDDDSVEVAHVNPMKTGESDVESGGEDTSNVDDDTETTRELGLVATFFNRFYSKIALNPVALLMIVSIFGIAFGICTWRATLLKQEFSYLSFLPTDSYLVDYFDLQEKYFATEATRIKVYMRPSQPLAASASISALHNRIILNEYTTNGTLDSWWLSHQDWATGSVWTTEEEYVSSVREFVASSGSRYSSDIVFPVDNSTIVASRFEIALIDIPTSAEEVKAMKSLRKTVYGTPAQLAEVDAFPYARVFIGWEQYAVIEEELIRNVALGMLAIAVVTLLLIAHPVTSLLVFITVASTIVNLFGLMSVWDVNIDGVVTINLIISLGFAVDYSAHIGHAFMCKVGTREERVVGALTDVGASVLNGAISTFLAIIVMGFSKSFVFITFFKLLFGVVVFGVMNGFLLLPVLLRLLGPEPYESVKKHAGDKVLAVDNA